MYRRPAPVPTRSEHLVPRGDGVVAQHSPTGLQLRRPSRKKGDHQ